LNVAFSGAKHCGHVQYTGNVFTNSGRLGNAVYLAKTRGR